MAYNTTPVIRDVDGNPISQYYNPATDSYEPVEGSSGGNKVVVENNDLSLIPILDKLSQLTGTVIDEETRKTNELGRISKESARVTTESNRVGAESTRVSNENTRKSNETARQTSESGRVTEEGKRVTAESNRASAESVRVSSENTRKSNETARQSQETTRETNEDLRIALYDDLLSKVASGFFKGVKGDTGNGLEYTWNGTQLGVRVEGDSQYVFVDLKGEKGDTGDIANLTSGHVTTALGYTPMPISGGVLENYREKLVTLSGTYTTINLSLGNVFTHSLTGNAVYSISNVVSGQAHSFTLIITQTATVRTLTFPYNVKWQGGEIPDMSTANKTYILTFMTIDGGINWLGMFGGEF